MSDIQLIGGLQQDLGGDDLPLDFTSEPLDLDVPAFDLGLVLAQDRPGLLEPRPGRRDLSGGDLHFLLGPPDLLLIVLNVRLLRLPVLAQLGHEEVSEHVALAHLVADIHVPFLDKSAELRIDRRALVTLARSSVVRRRGRLSAARDGSR